MPTAGDFYRHLGGTLVRLPRAEGHDRRMIDYAHLREGALYHGTVSNLDGVPKSTWTYEDRGRKVRRDQPIEPALFEVLWNGLADFAQARRYLATDPDEPLDPATHHVVGVAFDNGDEQDVVLFQIPADDTSQDLLLWLAALNVPQGSA
jgi:hypothetical protein